MPILYILAAILTAIFIFSSYKLYKKSKKTASSSLLERFKKEYKSSNKHNQRIREHHNIQLLNDPKANLQINEWDQEYELFEKMRIHRARLKKFGKSKMNNQVYYEEKEGNVFIFSKDGEKTNI